MDNKLQELTDKLYNEGLSKGKSEGEAILAKAKTEAEAIVAAARKEAEAIVAKAGKDAEALKVKTDGDIALASRQAVSAVRQAVEKLVIARAVDPKVDKALSSDEFVKQLILASVEGLKKEQGLVVTLPEAAEKSLGNVLAGEISKTFGGKVSVVFNRKTGAGFTIGPKDGGYFIDFTDEAFKELIGEYLRPATRKILFGQDSAK